MSSEQKTENHETEDPPGGREKPRDPPMNAREEWYDFLKTAFFAVLLAMIIRSLLFEPFNIPSGSMKPTLLVGDYLFVYKPAYGFSRYSFPFGLAPIEGRVSAKEPERGDVVVFKLPKNTGIDYIKRIVAFPGETVQVRSGRLYINDKLVPRAPVGMRRVEDNGVTRSMMEYTETLPGGFQHSIYEESDQMPLDNTRKYVVPENHYFVMGDNRDNSQDSRVQELVGFVPFENIVGRADLIFFSVNGEAGLFEVWKWPWAIRYDRLLSGIKSGGDIEAQSPGEEPS